MAASTEPTGTPSETDGVDAARSVTVANFLFQPETIKVASGDAVELQNTNPQTPHICRFHEGQGMKGTLVATQI
ncbi:MAG: hypothetical protein ACXWXN_08195 [Actinomycetota bacterium]